MSIPENLNARLSAATGRRYQKKETVRDSLLFHALFLVAMLAGSLGSYLVRYQNLLDLADVHFVQVHVGVVVFENGLVNEA